MFMKHIFVQTCQLVILLNLTYTYVLFAANLEDFRSIAKKFIPNKLADQLTDMAAQGSIIKLNKNKPVYDKKETDEETESEEVTKPPAIRDIKTTPKKRFAIKGQGKDIDFDELVDRVREQLEDKYKTELKLRLQKETYKKKDSSKSNDDYEDKSIANTELKNAEQTTETKVTTKPTTEDPTIYYDDNVTEKESTVAENNGMFNEADLTKTNDSYEDYKIPNKKNIFESDSETKTTKQQSVQSEEEESRYKEQRLKAVVTVKESQAGPLYDEKDYAEHKSEEVKAKTETLVDEPEQKDSKPKKLKGTMIPTREYYKLSSPNYYAKIRPVAEKYDFNEPLPEQDREPENLKYFLNPPARINKKIKLI